MSNIQLTIPGFSPDEVAFKNQLPLKENQNIIINGNFDIWQRNTSFANPTSNQYLADRFKIIHNGTGTRTITRQPFNAADRISSVVYGHPSYFMRYTKNSSGAGTNDPSSAADSIIQPVENIFSLSGTCIMSFWVRSSNVITIWPYLQQAGITTGTRLYNRVGLGSITQAGTPADWTPSYSVTLVANVWTQVSLSVVLDSNFGVSDLTAINNSTINFGIGINNLSGINVDITSICLERGNTVTQKTMKSIEDELKTCQRYYELVSAASSGYNGGGVWSHGCFINFRSNKRIIPTLNNLGDFFTQGSIGTINLTNIGTGGFLYQIDVSGNTTSARGTNYSADAEF